MKLRKKSGPPIEVKIKSIQGKEFTFQFEFIDYRPKGTGEALCCNPCPFKDICAGFPDPRDLEDDRSDFNSFCADMDDEIGDGKWTPIPIPTIVEEWLDEVQGERSN